MADGPDFPDAFKPLAAAMGQALQELRSRDDVRWTYISPAADFQADGARNGAYSLGGEELTLNAKGESVISYVDYAIAMVDEAVNGNHVRERISVVGEVNLRGIRRLTTRRRYIELRGGDRRSLDGVILAPTVTTPNHDIWHRPSHSPTPTHTIRHRPYIGTRVAALDTLTRNPLSHGAVRRHIRHHPPPTPSTPTPHHAVRPETPL